MKQKLESPYTFEFTYRLIRDKPIEPSYGWLSFELQMLLISVAAATLSLLT